MTQDAVDIKALRALFWAKFWGEITLVEMQEAVEAIMNRQLALPEVKNDDKFGCLKGHYKDKL